LPNAICIKIILGLTTEQQSRNGSYNRENTRSSAPQGVRSSRLGKDWEDGAEDHWNCSKHRICGVGSADQLDQTVNSPIKGTMMAVNRFTPLARPFPYSKRWFTPDLKMQQREVNKARRKWQGGCATRGKEDVTTMNFFVEMRTRRREWTRAIQRTKAIHWNEFLDKASSRTVWKATPYL
jgi:hypothetical protein